jgi:hypothetical protein
VYISPHAISAKAFRLRIHFCLSILAMLLRPSLAGEADNFIAILVSPLLQFLQAKRSVTVLLKCRRCF